jgi:hypothetical protein
LEELATLHGWVAPIGLGFVLFYGFLGGFGFGILGFGRGFWDFALGFVALLRLTQPTGLYGDLFLIPDLQKLNYAKT